MLIKFFFLKYYCVIVYSTPALHQGKHPNKKITHYKWPHTYIFNMFFPALWTASGKFFLSICVTLPCLHTVHKNGHYFAEVVIVMWQPKKWSEKNQNTHLEILPHRVRIYHHFDQMSYFRPPWGAGGQGLLFRYNQHFEPVKGLQLNSDAK